MNFLGNKLLWQRVAGEWHATVPPGKHGDQGFTIRLMDPGHGDNPEAYTLGELPALPMRNPKPYDENGSQVLIAIVDSLDLLTEARPELWGYAFVHLGKPLDQGDFYALVGQEPLEPYGQGKPDRTVASVLTSLAKRLDTREPKPRAPRPPPTAEALERKRLAQIRKRSWYGSFERLLDVAQKGDPVETVKHVYQLLDGVSAFRFAHIAASAEEAMEQVLKDRGLVPATR